ILDARFTDLNGISGIHEICNNDLDPTIRFKLSHCYIGPGTIAAESPAGGSGATGLTNNIFERVNFSIYTLDFENPVYFYNNTIRNSAIWFADDYAVSGERTIRDNLFDNSSIYVPNPYLDNYDHNAYYQTTPISPIQTGDVTLTNLVYGSAPQGLGPF